MAQPRNPHVECRTALHRRRRVDARSLRTPTVCDALPPFVHARFVHQRQQSQNTETLVPLKPFGSVKMFSIATSKVRDASAVTMFLSRILPTCCEMRITWTEFGSAEDRQLLVFAAEVGGMVAERGEAAARVD